MLPALVCLALAGPIAASAQAVGDPGPPPSYPQLTWKRELVVSGLGLGLVATGFLIPDSDRTVTAAGLDPAEIALTLDRRVVGNTSWQAGRASDWTRNAALAMPFVLALVLADPADRWQALGPQAAVYAETMLVSLGISLVGKVALGRPRPFAYLPESERPDRDDYDVARARAFQSMPSGHSSAAFTAVGIAIAEDLLARPGAHWGERVAIGFVGGGLAGATAALRVRAGQHFPTDVLAGGALGLATGVAVPLLHRGERRAPSARAWLEVLGGLAAGTVTGVLVGL